LTGEDRERPLHSGETIACRTREKTNAREALAEPDCWETFLGNDNKPHERLAGGLRYTTRQMILDGGYELASLASRFAGRDTNELASIRSTVDTQTRWLLSKRPLRPCAL
jgi:type IV secretion system protein VirD4